MKRTLSALLGAGEKGPIVGSIVSGVGGRGVVGARSLPSNRIW